MVNKISEAAKNLAQVFQNLDLPGEFAPANITHLQVVKQSLDLSDDLIAWYSVASPQNVEIPGSDDKILWNGEKLSKALEGYRFDSLNGNINPEWNLKWIVIIPGAQYPVITKTATTNDLGIYLAYPSTTLSKKKRQLGWDLKLLSHGLADFLLDLAAYVDLRIRYYNNDIWDEDDVIRDDFVCDFTNILNQNAGTANLANSWIKDWFGF